SYSAALHRLETCLAFPWVRLLWFPGCRLQRHNRENQEGQAACAAFLRLHEDWRSCVVHPQGQALSTPAVMRRSCQKAPRACNCATIALRFVDAWGPISPLLPELGGSARNFPPHARPLPWAQSSLWV